MSGGEGAKIYLVNQNDELHLLYFHKHWATQRLALWNDITVEDSGTESYELGWTFDRYSVEISDGRIAEVTSSGAASPAFVPPLTFFSAPVHTYSKTKMQRGSYPCTITE